MIEFSVEQINSIITQLGNLEVKGIANAQLITSIYNEILAGVQASSENAETSADAE